MKRGQVMIFVIIALILVVVIALSVFLKGGEVSANECESGADCVPASCCHPTSCVAFGSEQDCTDVACTLNCQPGTLDCGQGSCTCVNNKCLAYFNE